MRDFNAKLVDLGRPWADPCPGADRSLGAVAGGRVVGLGGGWLSATGGVGGTPQDSLTQAGAPDCGGEARPLKLRN